MSEAVAVVKNGMSQASQFAEDAWQLVQNYVTNTAYTAFSSLSFGPVDIFFDPALSSKPLTSEMPEYPNFPEVPEIEDNFVMPDLPSKPQTDLPNAPVLADHTIPDFVSDVVLPQFTDVFPAVNLTPIEEVNIKSLFSFLTFDYTPQLSELHDILLDRIVNGGTGLPANIEDEIWNRNLERDQQALQDSVDDVTNQWAKMNWTLPDGLLASSILALNTEYANKRLDASREIAIKQAELEQVNINESLKLFAAIEEAYNGIMVQYINAAANALKTATDVAVALYNTTVQYYNLLLDVYKAKITVYQSLVEVKKVEADVYTATIAGIGQAIAADEAKVNVYVAEISAEEAKLKAYETELRGIIAHIEAIKTWLDIGKTRMDLFAAETRALTERFSSQVDGYKTEVLAWSSENDNSLKEKDISLREQIAEWDIRLKEYEFLMRDKEQETNIALEKMKTLTGVGAHIVAGALAASNVNAYISESENRNLSGSI